MRTESFSFCCFHILNKIIEARRNKIKNGNMPNEIVKLQKSFRHGYLPLSLPHGICHSSNTLEVKKGQKELVLVSFFQAGKMERTSTGGILHLFRYRILAWLYLWCVCTAVGILGLVSRDIYACHYAPDARVLVIGMDCIDLGASTEKGRNTWSRTTSEWIRAAFLSSTSAEALQQDLWWEWHAESS